MDVGHTSLREVAPQRITEGSVRGLRAACNPRADMLRNLPTGSGGVNVYDVKSFWRYLPRYVTLIVFAVIRVISAIFLKDCRLLFLKTLTGHPGRGATRR